MTSEDDLKKTLRARLLEMRQKILAPLAKDSAKMLVEKLLLAIPPEAKIVAGYRAIRGEIDVAPAMEALASRGHALCLPVVTGESEPLQFRAWKPGEALVQGTYGVEVPGEGAETVVPDVVIVPLLAVDAEGHRLGYGAGYYDRTIRHLRDSGKEVCIIGAAYSIQLAPGLLPAGEHDEALDAAATERSIIRFT